MESTKKPNPRYVGILAAAACLILVIGWLARPARIPRRPAPLPSETELEQLARRAERRSLDSMTKYFAAAARDVEPSIGRVRDGVMSGVAWTAATVVTGPIDGAPHEMVVTAPFGEAAARPDIVGPHLPLATLQGTGGAAGLVPARRAASPPAPGDWVLAVWRPEGQPAFAAGNFHQYESVTCGAVTAEALESSLSLTGVMVGGGLFNLDGELLGVILPCQERIAAIAVSSVEAILASAGAVDERLRGRYGLVAAPLSREEADFFKRADGLVVREVWRDSAAEAAGLRPGDIITASAGTPVSEVDDLRTLATASDGPLEVKVRRGAQALGMNLAAAQAAGATGREAGAGLTLAASPEAFRIDTVRPGSRGARAGIKAGDSLVRVNFVQPRSAAQLRAILSAATPKPMWLELDRQGRRLGVLLH